MSGKMCDVTVIICTYNRAPLLRRSLDALAAMEIPPNCRWELIVVDNASTDETPQVIEAFSKRLPVRRLAEPRAGKSYAANTAVAASLGSILLWVDDDAFVQPTWLTHFLSAFERLPADIIYGKVDPHWETEPPAWFSQEFGPRLALLDHGPVEKLVVEEKTSGYGVNYGFRREVIDRIGPFRVDFGPTRDQGYGGEDTIFFDRAHALGIPVAYSPHVAVAHFVPAERCDKAYHRRRAWVGSEQYFRYLRERYASYPTLLNVPRFFVGRGVTFLSDYLKSIFAFDAKKRFSAELRLISYVGVLVEGLKQLVSWR